MVCRFFGVLAVLFFFGNIKIWLQKKEYQEDVINDRVLVDEFLYGGSAPKDTNLPFGRKQLVEAQTEQKPSKDVEREIRLRSSIVTNILDRYPDFYREIFDGMMPNWSCAFWKGLRKSEQGERCVYLETNS